MKKKKRRRTKKSAKFLFSFVIVLGAILLLNLNQLKMTFLSHLTGYQKETIDIFLEEDIDIYDDIIKNKYSKTLDEIANTEYYKNEFILEYININYAENEEFLEEISVFLEKGYNSTNINNFYTKLKADSVDVLLEEEYFKDIDNIIAIPFFKEEKLKRYISYATKEEDKDIETVVTYVNIGLDNSYYTNIQKVDNPEDILVLVNKYNQLGQSYVPDNLQNVSYGSGKLRKEAADAFDKMCGDAKKDNIKIYGGSGYRSYSYQSGLYNTYVSRDGKKLADTYSARAGHSEHQTGLAMDVLNGNWSYIDETDKEYEWLINNAYKYGFILRYLKNKEEITGYQFEPWHYRYVGVEVATELKELNITYDEYAAIK